MCVACNRSDTTCAPHGFSHGFPCLTPVEPRDAGRYLSADGVFSPGVELDKVARQSQQDPQKHSSRRRVRMLHVPTWPVAAKLVGLCVGVAAGLAVGLTALGYTQ